DWSSDVCSSDLLGLDQNLDQRRFVQLLERSDDRQTADELGNQPELDEVLGLRLAQQHADVLAIVRARDLGTEANAGFRRAVADDLLESVECAAANEQDIRGVDLHELLIRVLAPALRRY